MTSWGPVVFKTRMPTSCQVYKNLLVWDWPVFAAASKHSKDHQEQASTSLHANHQWRKILFEDPEVLLAAELGLWPWRLQERSHGASARAPSQQGAQFGCQQRPPQLADVGLDSSNKAEAACLVQASSKPTSLAFLVGIAVSPRRSQNVYGNGQELEQQETTHKNEILLYWTSAYVFGNMLQQMFWETSPNG
jgi:hypothetical protein